jgi:cytochrome c1
MKQNFLWITIIVIIAVCVLAACTQATDTPSADKSEAEVLIDERCSSCHSANKVYSENLSRDEWSTVFDDMIAKGAEVNESEKALMIEWLVSGN